jgi:hypothetical protein
MAAKSTATRGTAGHTPRTPACPSDASWHGSYGEGMPIALAYVLGVAPFLALGGGLFRLTRP